MTQSKGGYAPVDQLFYKQVYGCITRSTNQNPLIRPSCKRNRRNQGSGLARAWRSMNYRNVLGCLHLLTGQHLGKIQFG